jgi:glycosyltransferase involved in cell wall biosynthesis
MIVKNEMKYLENTLKALAPLREAVDCKLVIVDTGSTDKSDKLAEEYADDFRRFEWVDDFSAARNKTLEGIDSEWYMFIDADETADDITPLIEFFNSGEYKDYDSAGIIIKNILSNDSSNEFRPIRLVKVIPGLAFEGSIHEMINAAHVKIKYTDAHFNHYGYYANYYNQRRAKELRNGLILEKSVEKNPDNPNVWFQLAETCFIFDGNKAEAAWQKAFELSFSPIASPIFKYGVLARMEMYYTGKQDFEKVSELSKLFDETLSKETGVSRPTYTEIENAFYTGTAYSFLERSEECAAAFTRYRALMKDFKAGKFNTEDNQFYPIVNATEGSLEAATEELANCFVKLGRHQKAAALLEEIGAEGRTELAFEVMKGTDNYRFLSELAKASPDETYEIFRKSFSGFITETAAAEAAAEAFAEDKKYSRLFSTVRDYVMGKSDNSKLTLGQQLDLIRFFHGTKDKVRRAVMKTITEDYVSKVYLVRDPVHYLPELR